MRRALQSSLTAAKSFVKRREEKKYLLWGDARQCRAAANESDRIYAFAQCSRWRFCDFDFANGTAQVLLCLVSFLIVHAQQQPHTLTVTVCFSRFGRNPCENSQLFYMTFASKIPRMWQSVPIPIKTTADMCQVNGDFFGRFCHDVDDLLAFDPCYIERFAMNWIEPRYRQQITEDFQFLSHK